MTRKSAIAMALLTAAMAITTITVSQAQVPLSANAKKYYQANPGALQELQQQLLQRLQTSSQQAAETPPSALSPLVTSGTWTNLVNPVLGNSLANPRLLTDGTVIAHDSSAEGPFTPGVCGHAFWYKLTPDINGNYINGTWSQIASLQAPYQPRFFGSGVLPDGRVVAVGGEYNGTCGSNQDTSLGQIYDPVANTWTVIPPPTFPAGGVIGDATGIVLPSGTYMQTSCCANTANTPTVPGVPMAWTLNPATLAWTLTGAGKADWYDEEAIALLQNGKLLTVDAYVRIPGTNPPGFWTTSSCGLGSELFDTTALTWSAGPLVTNQQSDCLGGANSSFEVGPLVVRPDGTAVSFSGVTQGNVQVRTTIYNQTSNTWANGPFVPCVPVVCGIAYTLADAPAAVLPNGNILFAASPSNWTQPNNTFLTPVHYFELECGFSTGACNTNTITQVNDRSNSALMASFQENLLVLPTGQVIAFSTDNPTVSIYTPVGTYDPSWRPVVTLSPPCVIPGQTYAAGGSQFNGLTQGAFYGDDEQGDTNYPIMRIVNNGTGHVFYARTFNHASRSIAPNAPMSTDFQVSASTELGASTLYVVANGIPSVGTPVLVDSTSCTTQQQMALIVQPVGPDTATGHPGGPFSPTTFSFAISTTSGNVSYSITGIPTWLKLQAGSHATGTATTKAKIVNFLTTNTDSRHLGLGTYTGTLDFNNLTNGFGSTDVNVELIITPKPLIDPLVAETDGEK